VVQKKLMGKADEKRGAPPNAMDRIEAAVDRYLATKRHPRRPETIVRPPFYADLPEALCRTAAPPAEIAGEHGA